MSSGSWWASRSKPERRYVLKRTRLTPMLIAWKGIQLWSQLLTDGSVRNEEAWGRRATYTIQLVCKVGTKSDFHFCSTSFIDLPSRRVMTVKKAAAVSSCSLHLFGIQLWRRRRGRLSCSAPDHHTLDPTLPRLTWSHNKERRETHRTRRRGQTQTGRARRGSPSVGSCCAS